jgi:hypothetical protein
MNRLATSLLLVGALTAYAQQPKPSAAKPETTSKALADHDQVLILKAAMKAQSASASAQQAQGELQGVVKDVMQRNGCVDVQQSATGDMTCIVPAAKK